MIELAIDELAVVVGGETSGTYARLGPLSYSTVQSDYNLCVELQRDVALARHPPNRFLGFIGPDRNRGPRAEETMRLVRENCDRPPQP